MIKTTGICKALSLISIFFVVAATTEVAAADDPCPKYSIPASDNLHTFWQSCGNVHKEIGQQGCMLVADCRLKAGNSRKATFPLEIYYSPACQLYGNVNKKRLINDDGHLCCSAPGENKFTCGE